LHFNQDVLYFKHIFERELPAKLPDYGWRGCPQDVSCAHPGFVPYLARICCPKSVACIRQNGFSGCAHQCSERPLCASVSEMTLVCIHFKVGLGISPTNADSRWNPVYNAFHQKNCCGNETIRWQFCKRDLDAANLRPALLSRAAESKRRAL